MLIGLSALSFSYRCGLIGRGTGRAVARPMSVDDVIILAARAGLQSVEFPLDLLPDLSATRLDAMRERLAVSGLVPVADSDVADVETLRRHIPAAAALGARVLRVLISPVLEGMRSQLPGGWEAHMAEVIERLRAVRPLAEEHGVTIAIENHQDATSADLAAICAAVGGERIGVTFDVANALVVAEDPLAALERLSPLITNIHLSDYVTYPTTQGWRLVRCALGEGDLNLRAVFAAIERHAPAVTCHIELISHTARHVRLLEDEWWRGYPPRDVRDLLPVLRQLAQALRSRDDDWRTPWERGAGEAQISFYEEQQYASSVSYLRSLGVLPRARS